MKQFIFLLFIGASISSYSQNYDTITVYFDYDSHSLSESELSKLLVFRTYSHVTGPYSIEAHTDSSGTDSYNKILAKKRLNEVLKYVSVDNKKTRIIGEAQSKISSNYIDSKFRKVDILYSDYKPTLPSIEIESSEVTLESGVEDFINSNETTLSIDLYIHFQPGTAIPLPESTPEIDRLFNFLKENESLDAFLHGHVCCAPDIGISTRRAGYVYNYLIKNGISESRLQKKGHGNTQPKTSPELTEEDRISNRRVNVVFTKQ